MLERNTCCIVKVLHMQDRPQLQWRTSMNYPQVQTMKSNSMFTGGVQNKLAFVCVFG